MRWILCQLLLHTTILVTLSSCRYAATTIADTPAAETTRQAANQSTLWSGALSKSNWLSQWGKRDKGSWGLQNLKVLASSTERFPNILRVYYPAGSASPSASRKEGAPAGGGQFYADLKLPPQTALRLSYYVRFSKNFDFVKGGKLPGLFGGKGNSGGKIPDGTDGFSTRFMWRRQGDGEVYAYLPTSKKDGTSIERGSWRFRPGVWHHLEQEVVLNQPNQRDGRIRVWFDNAPVVDESGLQFRTVDSLKIEGLFFSTFFGGNDSSWATPNDVYIDFANFSVMSAKETP